MLLFFTVLADVFDRVKRELNTMDRVVGHELGFRNEVEFSKAKHGEPGRPFDAHRIARAPKALRLVILEAWLALEKEELAVPVDPNRDLLDAMEQVLRSYRRQAKAALRLTAEREIA